MTLLQYDYRSIPIDKIIAGSRRIRGERNLRIEALAADIDANGQLQPILVVELEDGSFDLDDGFLRLEAMRVLLKSETIDARVTPKAAIKPEEQRLRGLMVNLNRDDFTALERAEALCALKADYELVYPETKKGGDKGNQYTGGKKRQTEIFSFSQKAADATGLSDRAIRLAIAMVQGLCDDTKARVRGTEVEKKQADLRILSIENSEIQAKALDLYFSDQADSISNAIIIAKGGQPEPVELRVYRTVEENWKRFTARQKRSFIAKHQAEIRTLIGEVDG